MKERIGDRTARIVVRVLATWLCVVLNIVVWEGLPIVGHRLGWSPEAINYQLSVWPVLIDLIILRFTLQLTQEQITMARAQSAVLDALTAQTDATYLLLTQGAERDAKVELLLQEVRGEVHEMAEDVEDIVDELTDPAEVLVRLETDEARNAREAATKRGD